MCLAKNKHSIFVAGCGQEMDRPAADGDDDSGQDGNRPCEK
jgi:hypothetical protein